MRSKDTVGLGNVSVPHTTRAGGVILNDVDTGDSDEALVDRTLEGDSTAYAVLVRRYRRAALARALAVVGDEFDAEDVAQESFVQAYDQLATCRDPSRFGAWLLTIVRRSALNRSRSIRRRRAAPLEPSLPVTRGQGRTRRAERAARAAARRAGAAIAGPAGSRIVGGPGGLVARRDRRQDRDLGDDVEAPFIGCEAAIARTARLTEASSGVRAPND